jgi:hypothetical protein
VNLSPMAKLALAWLACRPDGVGQAAQLRKGLAGFIRLADPANLPEALTLLETQALVARDGGRLRLTATGQREAEAFLGPPELPARARWDAVVRARILPRMLDAPGAPAAKARAAAASADDLRALVLARREALPVPAGAALRRTVDALGWKLLGREADEPFTRPAVLAFLVNRALGTSRAHDLDAAVRMLAARATGARRPDARELRDAVARAWLAGDAAPPVDATAAPPDDLAAFAARVAAAARGARTGRFGDNKVFISHVYRAAAAREALDEFKQRLVEAHRGGLLSLSRADLVEAMDPGDVAESETRYLDATFHFVRLT